MGVRTFASELSVVLATRLVTTHDALDVLPLVHTLGRASALRGVGAGGRGHLQLPQADPGHQAIVGDRRGDHVVAQDGRPRRVPPVVRHQGHAAGEAEVQRVGWRPGRTQDPGPAHRQGVVRKNNDGGGRERENRVPETLGETTTDPRGLGAGLRKRRAEAP